MPGLESNAEALKLAKEYVSQASGMWNMAREFEGRSQIGLAKMARKKARVLANRAEALCDGRTNSWQRKMAVVRVRAMIRSMRDKTTGLNRDGQ